MLSKLSEDIRTQFIDLIVSQDGEPEDGPILLSNYYGINKVNKQLIYYIAADHSQKSVNKIYVRNEAYDKWANIEEGFALVVDVVDETCLIEEVKAIFSAIKEGVYNNGDD